MGLKLAGIMFLIMALMGGLGYWYYNDTQEKMAILVANEAKAKCSRAASAGNGSGMWYKSLKSTLS